MDNTKQRILNVVEAYKIAFPDEYKVVAEGNEAFRKTIKDDKFATTGSVHFSRQLYVIPERLHSALVTELSLNELEYFKSIDGARWFANQFNEFRIPEKI